jgi:hypothetical protein
MTLFGLDLNAGRARAVAAPAGEYALPVPLDPPHAELPLALSLAGGRPEVGRAGLRLCRRAPHLVRTSLLPAPPDNDTALSLALRQLARSCQRPGGCVLAVPAYLETAQVSRLFDLAESAGLRLLGCVAAPLALALAAHAEQTWPGTALVIDADEHALSVSTVAAAEGQAHLREARGLPRLGLRVWRERLLNAVADRCIRQSRRDPRDCPEAEQTLFDLLDDVLESCRQGRAVTLGLQAASWYQSVLLRPEDVCAAVAALARLALEQVAECFAAAAEGGTPGAVFVSAAAARLPGLVAGLQQRLGLDGGGAGPAARPDPRAGEDFGEGLLEAGEGPERRADLLVLGPDAAGRSAHGLAAHFERGELPPGYLDVSAPLPLPLPPEAGPARLRYQGEEYLVKRDPFALGRQASCDLVFDGAAYPTVAPRHCEIVHAGQGYAVQDRSRGGTLVNDRPVPRSAALQPGDALRLGPGGPVLRFLGQAAGRRPLTASSPLSPGGRGVGGEGDCQAASG